MSLCLKDCPDEVIEDIVRLLDLDDIRNLRQSCRSLAAKATQDHFKSFYRSKHLDITPQALRGFVDVTHSGRLGCLVEELVLVGLTNGIKGHNSKPLYSLADTELVLLSEAFSNIASSKKSGGLLSLSLEVAVVQGSSEQRLLPAAVVRGGWKFVWQCAAETFHTTMRALAASRLPIEKLDVFDNRQLQSCSLACNELSRVDFQDKGLAMSLSSLKSLSISLSDRIIDVPPTDFSQPRKGKEQTEISEARRKSMELSNFVGLAKFLSLACSIDNLEIHYYRLETAQHLLGLPYDHHEHLIRQVARSKKLPKLKQCSLRGIYVSDTDLLAFIQQTTTRRLFMENVTMSSGTFTSVFDYCTSEAAGMEELHFNELFEKHEKLYFRSPEPTGDATLPVYQTTSHTQGITSLQRVGSEVKQPIIYHYYQGMVADTPTTRGLVQKRRREYGPPRLP